VFELTSYLGLFLVAFGAATLLPLQSEAVMVGMMLSEQYVTWLLLVTATAGNVAGSFVNWLMGRSIVRFRDRRWFPVNEKQLDKAQDLYGRYGRWALLLSWVPVIGDPITLIAGVMRESFWTFAVIVTAAKFSRYLILASITAGWFS
jgi:membrane protein YqaA with SNARE-associated domain